MSRRDKYHPIVKQALIHEGWTITHDPYSFQTDPPLSTDIGAERVIAAERDHEKIAVEVKSFLAESQVTELERALGQYGLYQGLLEMQEPERELYLAVPENVYANILSRQVGQVAMRYFHLNLIVFSLSEEQPLQWKKA